MLRSLASPDSSANFAPAGRPGAATGAEYYPANEAPPVLLTQVQAPAAGPRRGFDELPDPDNYGLTERLFQQNFLEALTFYRIAEWLGHPQARISREGLENLLLTGGIPDMSKEEAEVLITKAAFQADRWMSPFEYYPEGEMESGLKHTDECPVSSAWSDALSRVDSQLPMAYVVSALRFLGFFRGSLKEASAEFQKSIGETPTGYLNETQKVRAIQAAALRGHAPAQNRLGVMYVKGIGVAKNFVRAEKWFELAADQQSAAANYHLSVIYSEGARGVPQDKDKATRYHVRAMAAGFRPSMREFSRLIESGARKPGGENPASVEPPPPK
jgi:TPR repeat protein